VNCKFQVGDKVVCVDAKASPGTVLTDSLRLAVGTVYTVSRVGITQSDEPGVQLVECPRDNRSGLKWYRASRFRPVRTVKTDISIFRQIDADVFGKQPVRA
jgi:hypothetical protein